MKERLAPASVLTLDPAWLAVFAGPLTWYLDQQASYWLTPLACNRSLDWPLFALSGAMLLADVGGFLVGWNARGRFLGKVGALGTALFALAILSDIAAKLLLGPCQK
jgi:hypothetical protein